MVVGWSVWVVESSSLSAICILLVCSDQNALLPSLFPTFVSDSVSFLFVSPFPSHSPPIPLVSPPSPPSARYVTSISNMMIEGDVAARGDMSELPSLTARLGVSLPLLRSVFSGAAALLRAAPWVHFRDRQVFEMEVAAPPKDAKADIATKGRQVPAGKVWVAILGSPDPTQPGVYGLAVFFSKLDAEARILPGQGAEVFRDETPRCSYSGRTEGDLGKKANGEGKKLKRTKPALYDTRSGADIMYADGAAQRCAEGDEREAGREREAERQRQRGRETEAERQRQRDKDRATERGYTTLPHPPHLHSPPHFSTSPPTFSAPPSTTIHPRAHWPSVKKFAKKSTDREKGLKEGREYWALHEVVLTFENPTFVPFDDHDDIDK